MAEPLELVDITHPPSPAARLESMVETVLERTALRVQADAILQWPVGTDGDPSRDMFDPVRMSSSGGMVSATIRNRADYATEIRGGTTVRKLIEEPLARAADALSREIPFRLAEVLDV